MEHGEGNCEKSPESIRTKIFQKKGLQFRAQTRRVGREDVTGPAQRMMVGLP